MDRHVLRQLVAQRVMRDLKWQEPPVARGGRGPSIIRLLPELAKHPGRWAILREYPKSKGAGPTASRLRTRFGDAYEFVSRTDGNGGSVLYGRKIK